MTRPDVRRGSELDSECRSFFAARVAGPPDAREAVLEALAAGAPYQLAQAALEAASELGLSVSRVRRIGLIAEVLRAALRVCAAAYEQQPLPTRLDRARRVLVADTLLTFAWELAADLPQDDAAVVSEILARAAGRRGFLAHLVSGGGKRSDPERGGPPDAEHGGPLDPNRAAADFLVGALRRLAPGASPETEERLRAAAGASVTG